MGRVESWRAACIDIPSPGHPPIPPIVTRKRKKNTRRLLRALASTAAACSRCCMKKKYAKKGKSWRTKRATVGGTEVEVDRVCIAEVRVMT